jgi:uncharacterized membrane protein YagU involved in acid resistance
VTLFLDGSPWGPPRMIGAIILGKDALPPPATFDFGILMVAIMLHMVLSIIYAIIIAFIVKRMSFSIALAVGAVIGLVIYFVNFYIMTGIFPWFANARNWVSAFSHVAFGIGAAWAYIKLQEHYAQKSHITTSI